jgi:hypothetical protein
MFVVARMEKIKLPDAEDAKVTQKKYKKVKEESSE